jgi:hypothetical protein
MLRHSSSKLISTSEPARTAEAEAPIGHGDYDKALAIWAEYTQGARDVCSASERQPAATRANQPLEVEGAAL